jgi:hypothetical protein
MRPTFIGASSSFTFNQRQIDIEFSLPPPAPTRLVHVCAGRGVGFMYAESLLPNGQMIPVNATLHIDARDFGSSLAAPLPQGALLPVTFWLVPGMPNQIPGYTLMVLRRLKLRSVFNGPNLRYRRYLPRGAPNLPMITPDPNTAPVAFEILEYGGQIQNWRKIQ